MMKEVINRGVLKRIAVTHRSFPEEKEVHEELVRLCRLYKTDVAAFEQGGRFFESCDDAADFAILETVKTNNDGEADRFLAAMRVPNDEVDARDIEMLRTCEEYSRLNLYDVMAKCSEAEQKLFVDMIMEERQLAGVIEILGPNMNVEGVAGNVMEIVERAKREGREPDMSEMLSGIAKSKVLNDTLENLKRPEGLDTVGRMLGHHNLRDSLPEGMMEKLQNVDMAKMMENVTGMLSGKTNSLEIPDDIKGGCSPDDEAKIQEMLSCMQGSMKGGAMDMSAMMASLGEMTKKMKDATDNKKQTENTVSTGDKEAVEDNELHELD